VLTIDPHTLDEVLASVLTLGRATGAVDAGEALVRDLRARIDAVRRAVADRVRPRVLLLEWTDPPFAPGHWVPEMVTVAGGVPTLGRAGEKSWRVDWDEVRASDPEVVVCAPCGYDLAGAVGLAEDLKRSGSCPGCRSGRWTPTRRSRARGRVSWTGSRLSPQSCTTTSR
jgi:iron complex transport system substrate-binding protein